MQTCLAGILLARRLLRRFPFFTAYTLFAVCAEVCKLSFILLHQQNTPKYFYLYWTLEAIYAVLGFAAIREVFRYVFANFTTLRWFKLLLPAVAVLMLGFSVLIAVLHRAVDMGPLEEGIFSLQIAVRCLQLGIFFLTFWLARFFDLDYRQYAFGIAAGFGIAAAGILLGTLVRTDLGLKFIIFFQYVPAVGYCIAVTVWLASFLRPEPDDPFRNFRHLFTPELFLRQLQRYKQEVKGIFKP
ncbi:MAG TPA: hypothetical protein VFR84_01650 [Candidatus Angelobacter sp.]|nr:hypothetical protein [Candidatus Angelobacter sp.]